MIGSCAPCARTHGPRVNSNTAARMVTFIVQAYRSVDRPVTFAQVALSLGNRRLRVYFLSRILAGPKGSDRRSIRATCANSRLVGNPSLGITAGLLVTRPESGMADSGHERYP